MLINLEELKLYLDITTNDDDALLKIIADGAIDFAKDYCDNIIDEDEVEEIISYEDVSDNGDVFLSNTLNLDLTTVSKNTGTDYDPVWTPLTSADYMDFLDEGRLIVTSVPTLYKALKVEYTAGYTKDNITKGLNLALFALIGGYWNKKKSNAVSNESLSDANITWKSILSTEIKTMFKKYKKYEIYF